MAWNSDDGRLPDYWAAAQEEDEQQSGPTRDMGSAAWAVLTFATAAIRVARLIPWWLFALILLLILAR